MPNAILFAAAAVMAALPALANAQGGGHGRGHGANTAIGNQHRGAHCPPGLARRNPPCVPPGQARHLYGVGQRIPTNVSDLLSFGRLPTNVRTGYDIPSGYRYIYRDNTVYVVDPATRLVRDVIDILAR